MCNDSKAFLSIVISDLGPDIAQSREGTGVCETVTASVSLTPVVRLPGTRKKNPVPRLNTGRKCNSERRFLVTDTEDYEYTRPPMLVPISMKLSNV
jgi:hypothetical protein